MCVCVLVYILIMFSYEILYEILLDCVKATSKSGSWGYPDNMFNSVAAVSADFLGILCNPRQLGTWCVKEFLWLLCLVFLLSCARLQARELGSVIQIFTRSWGVLSSVGGKRDFVGLCKRLQNFLNRSLLMDIGSHPSARLLVLTQEVEKPAN